MSDARREPGYDSVGAIARHIRLGIVAEMCSREMSPDLQHAVLGRLALEMFRAQDEVESSLHHDTIPAPPPAECEPRGVLDMGVLHG